MRILHIENTAGSAYRLSRAQRKLGHDADVLVTWRTPVTFDFDYDNYYEGSMVRIFRRMLRTVKIARGYDVVHVHSGVGKRRLDYVMIDRLLHKPIIAHYRGSESRTGYGMFHQDIISAKIVSTPDLLEIHPDARYIPNVRELIPIEYNDASKLKVVHMHMNDGLERKGTPLVLQVVEELEEEFDFEFKLLEGVPHAEALSEIASSSIVIDEITPPDIGVKGRLNNVSQEAMAMGKVAISHIDDDLMDYYPELPVINVRANKEDLKEKLSFIMENPDVAKAIGERGIEYVRKNHNPLDIARRYIEIYESAI